MQAPLTRRRDFLPSIHERGLTSFLDDAKYAKNLYQKLLWLTELFSWVCAAKPEWQEPLLSNAVSLADAYSDNGAAIAQLVRSILLECRSVKLLSETGIFQRESVLSEALRRILPFFNGRDYESFELSAWLCLVFRSDTDLEWLRSEQALSQLNALLEKQGALDARLLRHLQSRLFAALLAIASRCDQLELREELEYLGEAEVSAPGQVAQGIAKVALCRSHLRQAELSAYSRERALATMDRIELLLETLAEPNAKNISRLSLHLAHAVVSEKDSMAPLRCSFAETAKNIALRTACAGERFVARTRRQYRKLLLAGAGAGFITFLTVVGKSWIFGHGSPAAISGAMIALNYAAGFLAIYLLGFKLVTKQPAIAGSALTQVLLSWSKRPSKRHSPLRYCAAILRSLATTAVTNILFVVLSVIGFHLAYRAFHHGQEFIDAHTATHLIRMLDPFHSLTIPAAVLTGILLWLSSIIGGWCEDFCLRHFRKNLTGVYGVASSISLGLLFGLVPVFGWLIGTDLDVRHMTLSTGALVLGACSLGFHGAWAAGLPTAVGGLAIVTLLNFGVAFVLGFVVAAHARGLDRSMLTKLMPRPDPAPQCNG